MGRIKVSASATATYAGVPPLADVAALIADRSDAERAMVSAVGREGAPVALSEHWSAYLRQVGVLGTGGGLTSRGVALRAILVRRADERDFPL